jgi:hypothetical protein
MNEPTRTPLSPDERKLLGECCYHIARWLGLSEAPSPSEAQINTAAMGGTFKSCAAALAILDILEPVDSYRYAVRVPLTGVRDHVANTKEAPPNTVENVIGAFLDAADHWISTEKDPFEVDGDCQQAMWAFVQLGFATREPTGFQWTEKIAPIMVANYLWSGETLESFDTQARAREIELADRIWAAIPIWRRHWLARRFAEKPLIEFSKFLFWHWDDPRLRLFSFSRREYRHFSDGVSVPICRILFKRLAQLRSRRPF